MKLYSLLSSRCKSCDRPLIQDQLYPYLYRNLQTKGGVQSSRHGSVFNIKFSPTDKLALGVCSGHSVVGYDPRTCVGKPVSEISPAHGNCVNCITFINDCLFATCSDDMTIRLWDLRNLGTCSRVLTGHRNWVKNIEFDHRSNRLFSVAFYDGVREWDFNDLEQYNARDDPNNLALSLNNPVRMRIAPDGSKMFISTRKSKCLIIDRFNGATLSKTNSLVTDILQNSEKRELEDMRHNRPAVYLMCNDQGIHNFRAIMSIEFHPCSSLAAIRYVDIREEEIASERTSMYDFGLSSKNCYKSHYSYKESASKYFKIIDEEIVGETVDFIKEFCFSPDGRVIASPHGNGVRLLAVDDSCTLMEVYSDDRCPHEGKQIAPELCVVNDLSAANQAFTSPVLSCRFANHDFILATGGYSGEFLFHQPRL